MATIKAARNAMATRFEVVAHGESENLVRAAVEEALDEIERLDRTLSLYNPSSEIAQINTHAGESAVRVSPEIFRLLKNARELSNLTGGAFDISIAPLVRCWGFMRSNGQMPDATEIAKAKTNCGMDLIQLDEENLEVRFLREEVMLDLGAIGKGYALDKAAEILNEAAITNALIHGGTSSIAALGTNGFEGKWKIAIDPLLEQPGTAQNPIAVLELENESLSVSAISGKFFEKDGKKLGHVLDPRTGCPVDGNLLAAVVVPSGMEADALSTALLVRGKEIFDISKAFRPEAKMLLVGRSEDNVLGFEVLSCGVAGNRG